MLIHYHYLVRRFKMIAIFLNVEDNTILMLNSVIQTGDVETNSKPHAEYIMKKKRSPCKNNMVSSKNETLVLRMIYKTH